MDKLPYELINMIVSYLDIGSCINLSQTCSRFRTICMDNIIYSNKNSIIFDISNDMKKNDFYDYYIMKNKHQKHIDIFFSLYKIKYLSMKINSL